MIREAAITLAKDALAQMEDEVRQLRARFDLEIYGDETAVTLIEDLWRSADALGSLSYWLDER